jgi:hypothetical protein
MDASTHGEHLPVCVQYSEELSIEYFILEALVAIRPAPHRSRTHDLLMPLPTAYPYTHHCEHGGEHGGDHVEWIVHVVQAGPASCGGAGHGVSGVRPGRTRPGGGAGWLGDGRGRRGRGRGRRETLHGVQGGVLPSPVHADQTREPREPRRELVHLRSPGEIVITHTYIASDEERVLYMN